MQYNITIDDPEGGLLEIEATDFAQAVQLIRFSMACKRDVTLDVVHDKSQPEDSEEEFFFIYDYDTCGNQVTSTKRCSCATVLFQGEKCSHMHRLDIYPREMYIRATLQDFEAHEKRNLNTLRY